MGIKAQGRTRKLNQNYRNTQQILTAAWNVIKLGSSVDGDRSNNDDEDDVAFPIVEPSAALRNGQQPVLHLLPNRQAEIESAIAKIQQLVNSGYQPNDIAIIYRYKARSEEETFNFLIQQLEGLGLGYYWVNQAKYDYNTRQKGIRLITTRSALGLEFKAVLVPWVQQFGVGDRLIANRELYVAMTRAQDILYLFGSGNFQIIQSLKHSNCLNVIECNNNFVG